MRFLLGLILGAAVVVLVAEGVREGDDWRGRLVSSAGAIARSVETWLHERLGARQASSEAETLALVELTEGAAARQPIPRPPDPRGVDDSPPARLDGRPEAADAGPGEPAVAAALEPEAPARVPEPESDLAAGMPEPEPEMLKPEAPLPEVPPPGAPPPAAPAPKVAPAPSSADDPAAESPYRLQTVWVPFHSRMSARGFADRLMESLNHPFAVERQGAGRYQVVFPYADEPERRALLAQAAEVTGLPL